MPITFQILFRCLFIYIVYFVGIMHELIRIDIIWNDKCTFEIKTMGMKTVFPLSEQYMQL